MKIAAVISEFDPFHNGHKYLIEETRRRTGCDGVVCIMSGSFTQRGKPAVCDKWARAEMALRAGADAVIELPFWYAVSSAQFFALGGITACRAIGAEVLSFGIESDEDSVREFAKRRVSEEYGKELVSGIRAGSSYASSAGTAIGEKRLKPNDILACEYIAAAGAAGYSPQFLMIKRAGAGHGSKETDGCFASASQIRSMLLDENWQELVRPFVPESTLEILARWRSEERFVTADAFSAALCVKIRTISPERIASLPFGGGGVGQLLYNAVMRHNSWDNIVSACTSSRYTSSRISRLMVRALAEGEKADMSDPEEKELIYFKGSIPYVRVLGVSSKSSTDREKGDAAESNDAGGNVSFRILSELASRCRGKAVPVTAPYDYLSKNVAEKCGSASEIGRKMLLADITAQAVYGSVLSDERRSAADRDLTEQFLRIV